MSNQDLYNGTFTQDVTDNILANTGLDISEIEELLPSQSSNCIELVMQGGRVVIHQLVLLATDLSNKECFETTINYEFCGQNFTYKVKLNITEDPFCDIPIITNITYNNMAFTITGSITSDVWLEYSTDNGATYTRLPNAFPAGASIVTNALPINVDLKIRLVAVCDETKVSNVVDYDYVEPTNILISAIAIVSNTSSTATCSDVNTNPIVGYVYVRMDSNWFILEGGFNKVKSDLALIDTEIIERTNPLYSVHPNSIYNGNIYISPSTGFIGTVMIADDTSQGGAKILLSSDGDFVSTSHC